MICHLKIIVYERNNVVISSEKEGSNKNLQSFGSLIPKTLQNESAPPVQKKKSKESTEAVEEIHKNYIIQKEAEEDKSNPSVLFPSYTEGKKRKKTTARLIIRNN